VRKNFCAYLTREKIMPLRSDKLTKLLLDDTVLEKWFRPMTNALEKVRYSEKIFKALPMPAFILFGCLRQLRSICSLREQIQDLFHLDPEASKLPVARSTFSDAMASAQRNAILAKAAPDLVQQAQNILSDKLAGVKGLGERGVYAIDATYQTESSRYFRVLPKEGGEDNQKGHMLLTYYDVRRGIPTHVITETSSMAEIRCLKEEGPSAFNWSAVKNSIFVVDRAFIDSSYWNEKKKKLKITVITRLKSKMNYSVLKSREVSEDICNESVLSDREIQLGLSKEPWRLIQWQSAEGEIYEYITNDLSLDPGVVAFLYYRRWDEEKYFDNFKNDLSNEKAWGKSPIAIKQQALLGMVSYILTRIFLKDQHEELGLAEGDTTQKKKHEIRRLDYIENGIGDAYRAFYSNASKITRQVWRFLSNCFREKSCQALYDRQLKPLLENYL
jgi:hypothetical protein